MHRSRHCAESYRHPGEARSDTAHPGPHRSVLAIARHRKFLCSRPSRNGPHPADDPVRRQLVRAMTKPYTEQDLSDLFDEDLIWRRKELSDMKSAVRAADAAAKPVLLRAIITMSYAHWEGYVRTCANRYFEYLTIRRRPYSDLERQIY